MKKTSVLWAVGVAVLCACLAIVVRPAFAQVGGGTGPMPRHFPHTAPTPPPSAAGPGKIRISLVDGDRGPVVLAPKNGGFVGEFVVWNDGPGPLTVSRVAVRSDDDDPRLPPRFNARFADGGGASSVIHPHSSKRVNITWIPDREPKQHEALGHVVLTSNDEQAGEVAMGFVAPRVGPASFLTAHILTWLLCLPLVGAVAALAMFVVGYKEEERLRLLVRGLTAAQCVLALVLYEGFNGAVTRVDGNDGFQFLERVALLPTLGVEYFVGVDGTSVSLVLLTAIVGFAGALAGFGARAEGKGGAIKAYYGLFSLLLAGAMGVFVSLDLALFAAYWVTMLAALVAVVAVAGAPRRRPVTVTLALSLGGSAAFLVFAVGALHAHSDPTFLADGTRTAHTFAIPELMRVAYNAKHLELFGCSWVKVVWSALFLAFAIAIPLIPLHRWFAAAIAEAPAPAAAVLAGVVVNAGVYGLLRVSMGILPDGSRWAATTLVAAGVVNVVGGAVAALRARGLREVAAHAAVGQIGFCMIGLGAMTREGLAGCLVQMTSRGVILAMLFLALGSRRDAEGASGTAGVAGLDGAAPLDTGLAVFAFLALAGAPGLSGFWGEVVPILGAFPVERVLAGCAAVGAVALAASHLRVLRRLLAGVGSASGARGVDAGAGARASTPLGSRELASLTPLILLCIALGVWPAPFFTLVQGGVSDLNQLVNPPGPDEVALADRPAR